MDSQPCPKTVTPDTIIMDLTDPQLQQELLNAQLALKAAKSDYQSLQAQLQSTLMDKKTSAAQVNADYTQDQLQAQTDKALYDLGVISGLAYQKSKNTADQLSTQHQLSQQQLDVNQKAIQVQLGSQKTKIDQAQALVDLYQKQVEALEVRSTIAGTLAPLATPVQAGEHVTAGTSVAEVIQRDKLKAALQIAETQARDIQLGQPASIDTHNGIIPGRVTRIDPSVVNGTRTVDVKLDGALPSGAVPQLSVDGTIDLERMQDVLYMGRPALGNENSTLNLFKVDADGKGATRVSVKVGRASGVNRTTRDRSSLPQKSLVVFQVALSVVLLVGAILMTKTLTNLENHNFGVAQNRYVLHFDPQGAGHTIDTVPALYREIQDRFSAILGVVNVSIATYSPLEGDNWSDCPIPQGHPAQRFDANCDSTWDRVDPHFLDAIGVPILRGRGFTEHGHIAVCGGRQ